MGKINKEIAKKKTGQTLSRLFYASFIAFIKRINKTKIKMYIYCKDIVFVNNFRASTVYIQMLLDKKSVFQTGLNHFDPYYKTTCFDPNMFWPVNQLAMLHSFSVTLWITKKILIIFLLWLKWLQWQCEIKLHPRWQWKRNKRESWTTNYYIKLYTCTISFCAVETIKLIHVDVIKPGGSSFRHWSVPSLSTWDIPWRSFFPQFVEVFFFLEKVLSRGRARGSNNVIIELAISCPTGSESLLSELSLPAAIIISSFDCDSVTQFTETRTWEEFNFPLKVQVVSLGICTSGLHVLSAWKICYLHKANKYAFN